MSLKSKIYNVRNEMVRLPITLLKLLNINLYNIDKRHNAVSIEAGRFKPLKFLKELKYSSNIEDAYQKTLNYNLNVSTDYEDYSDPENVYSIDNGPDPNMLVRSNDGVIIPNKLHVDDDYIQPSTSPHFQNLKLRNDYLNKLTYNMPQIALSTEFIRRTDKLSGIEYSLLDNENVNCVYFDRDDLKKNDKNHNIEFNIEAYIRGERDLIFKLNEMNFKADPLINNLNLTSEYEEESKRYICFKINLVNKPNISTPSNEQPKYLKVIPISIAGSIENYFLLLYIDSSYDIRYAVINPLNVIEPDKLHKTEITARNYPGSLSIHMYMVETHYMNYSKCYDAYNSLGLSDGIYDHIFECAKNRFYIDSRGYLYIVNLNAMKLHIKALFYEYYVRNNANFEEIDIGEYDLDQLLYSNESLFPTDRNVSNCLHPKFYETEDGVFIVDGEYEDIGLFFGNRSNFFRLEEMDRYGNTHSNLDNGMPKDIYFPLVKHEISRSFDAKIIRKKNIIINGKTHYIYKIKLNNEYTELFIPIKPEEINIDIIYGSSGNVKMNFYWNSDIPLSYMDDLEKKIISPLLNNGKYIATDYGKKITPDITFITTKKPPEFLNRVARIYIRGYEINPYIDKDQYLSESNIAMKLPLPTCRKTTAATYLDYYFINSKYTPHIKNIQFHVGALGYYRSIDYDLSRTSQESLKIELRKFNAANDVYRVVAYEYIEDYTNLYILENENNRRIEVCAGYQLIDATNSSPYDNYALEYMMDSLDYTQIYITTDKSDIYHNYVYSGVIDGLLFLIYSASKDKDDYSSYTTYYVVCMSYDGIIKYKSSFHIETVPTSNYNLYINDVKIFNTPFGNYLMIGGSLATAILTTTYNIEPYLTIGKFEDDTILFNYNNLLSDYKVSGIQHCTPNDPIYKYNLGLLNGYNLKDNIRNKKINWSQYSNRKVIPKLGIVGIDIENFYGDIKKIFNQVELPSNGSDPETYAIGMVFGNTARMTDDGSTISVSPLSILFKAFEVHDNQGCKKLGIWLDVVDYSGKFSINDSQYSDYDIDIITTHTSKEIIYTFDEGGDNEIRSHNVFFTAMSKKVSPKEVDPGNLVCNNCIAGAVVDSRTYNSMIFLYDYSISKEDIVNNFDINDIHNNMSSKFKIFDNTVFKTRLGNIEDIKHMNIVALYETKCKSKYPLKRDYIAYIGYTKNDLPRFGIVTEFDNEGAFDALNTEYIVPIQTGHPIVEVDLSNILKEMPAIQTLTSTPAFILHTLDNNNKPVTTLIDMLDRTMSSSNNLWDNMIESDQYDQQISNRVVSLGIKTAILDLLKTSDDSDLAGVEDVLFSHFNLKITDIRNREFDRELCVYDLLYRKSQID